MLQLTVKTLDSQNHSFSCDDDITVRGFKEHIAETVSIPADSQRLIYCGRVLHDEKKLTDYDVDGKVIHLVQRAPPQAESRTTSNESQRQNNNQGWQSGSRLHLRGHFPRNAMYLSAVSLPTEVVENHGSQAPQLSNTLSNSRLVTARHMLNKASQLMDRLDDPSLPLHPNPTENNSSESSTQASAPGGETEQENNSGNNETNTSDVNRIAQAASEMAAAFSAAALINIRLSPADDGGSMNVMDSTQSDQNDQVRIIESELELQNAQAQSSGTPDEAELQRVETDRPETSTADDSQNSRRATLHVPRPPLMAELLERLVATQDRLRPYIDRYRHLMSTDPILTTGASGPEGVAENQRVIDGVSECLHYLSHASHALSDIIVDMGQQPPRNLRCRPIIIQSSAILQAGIPIHVESHINFNGRSASTNNNSMDEGNEATRPSSPSSATSDQTGNRSTSANNRTTSQSTNGQQQSQGQSSLLGLLDLSNIVQMSTEQSPQNTVDLNSSNSMDATENDQNQTNNNNSTSNNGSSNMYMHQPFALIRDALQSVLGDRGAFQVDASGGTGGGNATSNVPFVTIIGQQMDINASNSGQSTQARSNIGTHPTTSTQTRSTSRPHVLHPHTPLNMGMGMGQNLDFDPYLPCNSHHVRRNPPVTTSSTSTSQSNQPNQFSTTESNNRSQSASRSSASTSTSTRQGPGGTSVTFTLVDHSNVARDILDNTGQGLGAMDLPLHLGELLQGSMSDNVHISFVGGGPNASEVHLTPNNDLPLIELLRSMNFRVNESNTRHNFLNDLGMFLLRNITMGNLVQLNIGQTTPLMNLRQPLREFLEHSFPNTSQETLQELVIEQIILLHRPYVRNFIIPEIPHEDLVRRPVDIAATFEAVLRRFCFDFLKLLFNNDLDNATFAQRAIALARKLDDQFTAILQYVMQHSQATVDIIVRFLVIRLTSGFPTSFQRTILDMLRQRIDSYAIRTTEMSEDEIVSLLVFKNKRPSAPPAEDPPAPAPAAVPERACPRVSVDRKPEVEPESEPQAQAQAFPSQQQPSAKSEFKKTEEIKEVQSEFSLFTKQPMETEASENKIAGFIDLAAGQDIPETFPGAENVPPEWVPIIARDSIRQRRQVQIDALNGGPIPFSDAYLSSMPSKRRKLIEQQKPQLLMSPTPTSTAIAASVERLVREGISHSRVDEVEGSANAVANAPAVRSAFGHAIRDCIHPSRLSTPDFPNSRRFPNATKVFARGEQDNEAPSGASSSSK
ncbi:large proline-rich protein bag6 isoform X2 [Phymastichus coffea]|uniref:large proline-rich protein bag6 isoform X2 n=1 Tax=Phymastichus coffea TaxID=108790 RepID=UPI00273C23AD|nr:large proline-rich protein bag6 isoform X2 [Phymastichus coffea]